MNQITKRAFKRAGLSVLCLETILAVSALPSSFDGKKTFKQYHQTCAGRISRTYYTSNRENITNSMLKSAMSHSHTKQSINDLFAKAENNTLSEIAGITTIDKNDKGYFLRFYTSKTQNEQFAEELLNAENKIKFIKQNEAFYKLVTDVPQGLYQECINQSNAEKLVDLYLTCSRVTEILNLDLLYWEHTFDMSGTVVSEFHLHREEPPSHKDLKTNGLILVKKNGDKHYVLYKTLDGESYKIN